MEMKFLMTSPKQKILTNKWQKTFSNKSLKVSLIYMIRVFAIVISSPRTY